MNDLVSEYQQYQDATVDEEEFDDEEKKKKKKKQSDLSLKPVNFASS